MASRQDMQDQGQDRGEWVPRHLAKDRPVYIAIADAIAEDIRDGRLTGGRRLPPQRALAARLGLDFTTVSRAYREAQRRGLLDARVGQGTFVRPFVHPAAGHGAELPAAGGERASGTGGPRFVDMTMNQPPVPDRPDLLERLRRGAADAVGSLEAHALLRYPGNAHDNAPGGGSMAARMAGVHWLRGRLPGLAAERVTVCPGTQGALLALLTALARPGDLVCAEALTYPGFTAVARQLGLTVAGAPMDGQGLDPDALRALFATHRPKALYCMPTLHNPTTATMPLDRREAVVAAAREHGVAIIEDDIYGPLTEAGPPPLAALAPDLVFHVCGLAKCLSPALRIAYVTAPDARQALRVAGGLRATALMASPVTAAIAARWIGDGTAALLLSAIREEAAERQRLAAERLPSGLFAAQPEGFHLWLTLPPGWTRGDFAGQLRAGGIAAVTADHFATGGAVSQAPLPQVPLPEAVRICLGAASDRAETRWVLSVLAGTLDRIPAASGVII